MLKIASFALNTFLESLSKIADYTRALSGNFFGMCFWSVFHAYLKNLIILLNSLCNCGLENALLVCLFLVVFELWVRKMNVSPSLSCTRREWRRPKSLERRRAWDEIKVEECSSMVGNFRKRLQKCIEAILKIFCYFFFLLLLILVQ